MKENVPVDPYLDVNSREFQETYLAVHKGLSKFEGKAKLTTWIFSLAYHKACDRLSEKDRGHLEFKEEQVFLATREPTSAALFEDISPWDTASDAVAEKRAQEGLIAQAVERLPQSLRNVYHLRDEEGLSGEEIAAMLEMPSSTLRVHLHRARSLIVQNVREELERRRSGVKLAKCKKTEVAKP